MIKIESIKGNKNVKSYRAAARWIDEYRPGDIALMVDGEFIRYGVDDDEDAILAAILDAVLTDDAINAFYVAAGSAGDLKACRWCEIALDPEDPQYEEAREICADMIHDGRRP